MKNSLGVSFLVMIGLLTVSVPLFAHHGNAEYGHAKQLTLKGTVTEWVWLNPHTFLKVDVKDDKGNVVHWLAEWSAPSSLINFGINRQTFKPGDEVTIFVLTPDNGAPVGRIQRVVLADGKTLRG
jgi:hypothetical protein